MNILTFYNQSILKNSVADVLAEYSTPTEKGQAFEALWDLAFKTGCVEGFLNLTFSHMLGNVNNAKLKKLVDFQKYLKNGFNRGNASGISDITLYDEIQDKYIFISSKFYGQEKSVKDYDVQDIVAMTEHNKNIYKKWEICLVVNNKKNVEENIKNSNKSSMYITNNIKYVLDITDLDKAFQKMKKINLNDFKCEKDTLTLKFHQEFMTNKTLTLVENGEKNILWGWKCRSGKSYGVGGLILKMAKKYDQINCLVITPAPTETLPQFIDELFERYNEFNSFNLVAKSEEVGRNSVNLAKKNIVVVSKQSLNIEKQTNVFGGIKFNLIVFDENHSGGTTDLSEKIIERYSNNNTVKLYLTATYLRPLSKWNIGDNCKLIWDIIDEQMCKKRDFGGLLKRHGDDSSSSSSSSSSVHLFDIPINNENLSSYDSMPDLHILSTMFQPEKYEKIKGFNGSKYGFSPETLFSLNKSLKKFNYPEEVSIFLRYISGSRKEIDFPNGDESIFGRIKKLSGQYNSRTTLDNINFTTQLWFLPFGQGLPIDKVSVCLKKHMETDEILKNFGIFILNSKAEHKVSDLKGEIEKQEKIFMDKGKRGLILLVGNQCSLGITLKKCDVVFLLNNTLSCDRIMQMMYRCMTDGDDKKIGFIFDPYVSRVLQTTIEYSCDKANTIQEKIKYVIENHLLNIDMDYFMTRQKMETITKMMDVWKSSPLNHFKVLLHKLEEEVITLTSPEQKEINRLFDDVFIDNRPAKIIFVDDDEDIQKIKTGKERSKVDVENEEEDEEENNDEEDEEKNINFAKSVLPFVIPLSCILTMREQSTNFLEMLKDIKNRPELIEIFNDQTFIWWNQKSIIDTITDIVENHISQDSISFNIANIFKESLVSLIDDPSKLLPLINEYMRPKESEKKKYGEVFTPMSLIEEMLDRLPLQVWSDKTLKWFDPASGMGNFFIQVYQRLMTGLGDEFKDQEERKKHILENMLYGSELNMKNVFIYKILFDIHGKYKLNIFNGDTLKELNTVSLWGIEKFDVIVGNPPYNASGTKASGNTVWQCFLEKSLNWLKNDGFLCMIHPPGWRKPNTERGKFYSLFPKMTQDNTLIYLEIHNSKDGMKTFQCGTRYDWYILQRKKNQGYKTEVLDEDKKSYSLDMSRWNWLPNGCFEEVEKLLVIEDEERCKILQSMSAYEPRKSWMSKDETNEFKYPVVHSTPKEGPRFVWSKVNDKGFFGTQKVIFGESGIYNPILDLEGKYGMSQGAMAIEIENKIEGEKIIRTITSPLFQKILDKCLWSSFRIEWGMFKDFRNNFYDYLDFTELLPPPSPTSSISSSSSSVSNNYSSMGIGKLKEIAKDLGIRGFSKFKSANKNELIVLIKENEK